MVVAEHGLDALAIIAIIFMVVMVPASLGGGILFWKRRHLHPISGRYPTWVVAGCFCCMPAFINEGIQLVIGLDIQPCYVIYAVIGISALPALLFQVVRVILLLFQFEITADLVLAESMRTPAAATAVASGASSPYHTMTDDNTTHGTELTLTSDGEPLATAATAILVATAHHGQGEKWEPNWYTRKRHYMRSHMIMRFVGVVMTLIIIWYAASIPLAHLPQTCNDNTTAWVNGTLAYLVIIAAGMGTIVLSGAVKLRHHDQDAMGIKREFKYAARVLGALLIAILVTHFTVSSSHVRRILVIELLLGIALLIILLVHWPLYQSYVFQRRQAAVADDAEKTNKLEHLLHIPAAFDAFLKFCQKEFNSEAVLFWKRIENYRATVHSFTRGNAHQGHGHGHNNNNMYAHGSFATPLSPNGILIGSPNGGIPPSPQATALAVSSPPATATATTNNNNDSALNAFAASLANGVASVRRLTSTRGSLVNINNNTNSGNNTNTTTNANTASNINNTNSATTASATTPSIPPGVARRASTMPLQHFRSHAPHAVIPRLDGAQGMILLNEATSIYTSYLRHGAHFEVNLSAAERQIVSEQIIALRRYLHRLNGTYMSMAGALTARGTFAPLLTAATSAASGGVMGISIDTTATPRVGTALSNAAGTSSWSAAGRHHRVVQVAPTPSIATTTDTTTGTIATGTTTTTMPVVVSGVSSMVSDDVEVIAASGTTTTPAPSPPSVPLLNSSSGVASPTAALPPPSTPILTAAIALPATPVTPIWHDSIGNGHHKQPSAGTMMGTSSLHGLPPPTPSVGTAAGTPHMTARTSHDGANLATTTTIPPPTASTTTLPPTNNNGHIVGSATPTTNNAMMTVMMDSEHAIILCQLFDNVQAGAVQLLQANSFIRFRSSSSFRTLLDTIRGWTPTTAIQQRLTRANGALSHVPEQSLLYGGGGGGSRVSPGTSIVQPVGKNHTTPQAVAGHGGNGHGHNNDERRIIKGSAPSSAQHSVAARTSAIQFV